MSTEALMDNKGEGKTEHKAEKFLVTTEVKGRSRIEIWDTSVPFGVGHPYHWVLQRTPEGVVALNIALPENVVKSGAAVKISNEDLAGSPAFRLPQDQAAPGIPTKSFPVTVKLKRIPPLKPAYLTDKSFGEWLQGKRQEFPALFAYFGVRRTLLVSERIHSAYVAYSRGRPVFTVYQEADGIKIKPLLAGVYIKLKHRSAVRGQIGETWQIKNEQMLSVTITRGWYWWRFNAVQLSSLQQGGVKFVKPPVDPDARWFSRVLFVVSALMIGLGLVTWLVPPPVEKGKAPSGNPLAPQVVKYKPPKAKPAKPPVQTAKAEVAPPMPTRALGKAAMGRAGEKSPLKSPVAAAAQLKQALGGALAMLKNSGGSAAKTPALARKGGDVFGGSKVVALAPTDVKPGFSGTSAKVGALGGGAGGGKGIGYGTGEKGTVFGTGNSFVAFDSGGSSVEEGLSKDEVGQVIHNHMGEIRYCYDSAIVHQPKIEGKMIAKFTILPNGQTKDVGVASSTLNESQLSDCILSRLRTWKFPKPKGGVGVNVSYPFVFKTLGRE